MFINHSGKTPKVIEKLRNMSDKDKEKLVNIVLKKELKLIRKINRRKEKNNGKRSKE